MIASLEPLMIDGEALARRRRKDPDTVRPCATRENAGARFLPLRAYLLAQCFILEELCHALRRLVHGSDWKTANAVFDLLLQTPAAVKRRTHVQHLHAAQRLRYAHNALHSVMSDERLPLTRLSNSSADVGLRKLPT